jgi:hypothetical protein
MLVHSYLVFVSKLRDRNCGNEIPDIRSPESQTVSLESDCAAKYRNSNAVVDHQ